MIKNIVRDTFFLSISSSTCTKDDLYIVKDLRDTLNYHRLTCVGMAANMIGYSKRMIIVSLGFTDLIMINPSIVSKKKKYITEEGCLSLNGVRTCVRYEEIEVIYYDESFIKHKNRYTGHIAEIIQHECDHLEGIII